jgi:hypothetical protein
MNKLSTLSAALLTGAALCLAGAGCTVYTQPASVNAQVEVDSDPPPVMVETIPSSPGPEYVWVGGSWAWHGRWVWEHGRWGRPPHPGAMWVANRYEYRNGHRVFIRGSWR